MSFKCPFEKMANKNPELRKALGISNKICKERQKASAVYSALDNNRISLD